MQARTKITLLASLAALALGVGIPLFALTAEPSTELLEGTVVSIAPARRAVLIEADTGADALRGKTVLVHVPTDQNVELAGGSEDLGQLRTGQRVRARVVTGSSDVRRIDLVDDTGSGSGP